MRRSWRNAMARAAFASAALGWVVLVGLIVRHRVYVSDDSVSNYAHVWFIATKLRHAHHLPYAMRELGHGHGLAYPYAFLPWTTAALAWLVVGEWAVTLWLVVGAGLTVVATFAAFPEIGPKRRPILAAGVLVNPALLTSLWFGQLPFLWAVALLLFGVAAWRRRSVQSAAGRRRRPSGPTTAQARRSSASVIVLVALAQGTHPAIVAPMALALVIGWWHWEPDHRGLARTYAGSTLLALPAMWLVIASPVFDDASTNDKLVNFVETFAMRSLVVVVPILLLILGSATTRTGRWKSLATVAMASFALAQFARTYHHFPWRAPVRCRPTRRPASDTARPCPRWSTRRRTRCPFRGRRE